MIPELLSPAGDRESLEAAVRFGADAVYLGGSAFGMRRGAAFDAKALADGIAFAHERGVKAYLCCNTLPSNDEVEELPAFLRGARDCGADALIVADVGVLALARETVPELEIHASTQAGVMNWLTARELYRMGASRVVLARELPLEEVRRIRDRAPPELELEAFVHGAMCMSVSGRCVISNYLTGRDANRGECAQPCRWSYHLMEEKRPGEYFPVFEDDRGSYILNAKDLCMIEALDRLALAGVMSFKIEGRAKAAYYAAAITNAYRGALDALMHTPAGERFEPPPWTVEEVLKVSHRPYCTGFYFGKPEQCVERGGYIRDWEVIATVDGCAGGFLEVTARNKFSEGEQAELMIPREAPRPYQIERIVDPEAGRVESARHAMRRYLLPFAGSVPEGTMLRRAEQQKIQKG